MLTLPPTSLRPGDRVCCAVSGGADSTALLLLMHAANRLPRNALGVGLSAFHVNHQLRGADSDADQSFVEALCEGLSIPLHVSAVETTQYAAGKRETIEEAARNLRYAAFSTLLKTGQATHVLTAHTLEDQAETVLMKLLRGAWLEGLSAIAPELTFPEGKIVRPLLRTRRDDLRTFLILQNQVWREDLSNADEVYTRNRFRHNVLPVLREENPAIDQMLANVAELAREEEARWNTELARVMPQIVLPGTPVRGGGRSNSTLPSEQAVALELERLRGLDPAMRRRVIRGACRQLGARLTFDETARILTLAGFAPQGLVDATVPTRAGSILKLGGGLFAQRTLRELRLAIGPAV